MSNLRDAGKWYEDIRGQLAGVFALSVDSAVEAIAKNPLQFPVVYRGRRRAGVWRFLYRMRSSAIRNAGNRANAFSLIPSELDRLIVPRAYIHQRKLRPFALGRDSDDVLIAFGADLEFNRVALAISLAFLFIGALRLVARIDM